MEQKKIGALALTSSLAPAKFTNDQKGQTAENFLLAFDTFTALHDLTDVQAAKIFPLFLGNEPLTWFTTLTQDEKESLEDIKTAFKKNFEGAGGVLFDSYQLLVRDQKPDEPLDSYLKDIYRLISKSNYTEPMNIALFVRGLRPKIREFVICSKPEN